MRRLSTLPTAFVTVATTLLGAMQTAAAGSCEIVAAAGNGPTEAIATVMSTHGLENIIEAKGLKGQGPVKTKCVAGSILVECRSQQKACK